MRAAPNVTFEVWSGPDAVPVSDHDASGPHRAGHPSILSAAAVWLGSALIGATAAVGVSVVVPSLQGPPPADSPAGGVLVDDKATISPGPLQQLVVRVDGEEWVLLHRTHPTEDGPTTRYADDRRRAAMSNGRSNGGQ